MAIPFVYCIAMNNLSKLPSFSLTTNSKDDLLVYLTFSARDGVSRTEALTSLHV